MYKLKIKPGSVRSCIFALVTLLSMADSAVASDLSPQELVRDTSSRMLIAMRENQEQIKSDASHLYALVENIVLPYFDFRRMSQWVLGKNWRKATAAERDQFVEQFRVLLVRTYSSALSEYADERIIYLPVVPGSNASIVTVRTEIETLGAGTIPIDYSMYRSGDSWKVYDISISGVSLVTNYRSTFGSIIRKEGIASLIEKLAERNRERADG